MIDGVEVVFQLAPETEAPAEMHMFYPALRALNLAENATHNLHNIYPIRGAQARDANAWAKYLDEARDRFARDADVVFAQHHWPVWGTERVLDFLARQRDAYKYLHDQTVRLMNHGWRAAEIAERLAWPPSLAAHLARARLLRHAQPQRQGRLPALPRLVRRQPGEPRARCPRWSAGRKYVEYMGGAAAAIARAREDFARGEYRFVAEAMSHVVFADPGNVEARRLGADALEQLGYRAESATWRNAYLLGALELRQGHPKTAARAPVSPDIVRGMSLELFFDYLGIRLDGERAAGRRIVLNWVFPDLGRRFALNLENSALTALPDRHADPADATVTTERSVLNRLVLRETTFADAVAAGVVRGRRRRRPRGRAVRPPRRLHADVPRRRAPSLNPPPLPSGERAGVRGGRTTSGGRPGVLALPPLTLPSPRRGEGQRGRPAGASLKPAARGSSAGPPPRGGTETRRPWPSSRPRRCRRCDSRSRPGTAPARRPACA